MSRSDFTERRFTCSICGEVFMALAGNQPVADPVVCMGCGLRYGPEQRRRLAEQRKKRHPHAYR